MHGLVTGEESRQQLYTMLTRGRIANHLYLQVVGDGDPHSLIRPETIHPSTPTEVLEQILARDGAAHSATTLQRDQHDPTIRLAEAAAHYVDALHMAAEDISGRELVDTLNAAAEQIMPGLTDESAWPTLRAHLLLLAAHGTDPAAQLAAAAGRRELNSADDRAAVLDWRLDDTGHRNAAPGPLPWLPGIPQGLRDHPVWGNYLAARSDLARTLADQIKATAADSDPPAWLMQRLTFVSSSVVGDLQVWRAAMQVSPEDRRPTRALQLQKAARTWQRHLDRQVSGDHAPALQEWGWLLDQLSPNLTQDPFAHVLADRFPRIFVAERRGRPDRPRLGELARLRVTGLVARQRRVRLDVAGRRAVERARGGHPWTERRFACNRDRRGDGAGCDRVHALACSGYRRRAGRVARSADDVVAGSAAIRTLHAAAVDGGHVVGPDARRLHLRALRTRTTARRVGACERAGGQQPPAGGLRDARLRHQSQVIANRSDAAAYAAGPMVPASSAAASSRKNPSKPPGEVRTS